MNKVHNIEPVLTTDANDFMQCAIMMSSTDPWLMYDMDVDKCMVAFGGEGKEIYKILSEGKIIAFIILQVLGTFKGYIQTLCVDEAYRNLGLGHQLLEFCEKRILKISPNIFICVSTTNTKAQKLYYEYGFTLIGVIADFLRAGFHELLLRKTIGPIVGYKPN